MQLGHCTENQLSCDDLYAVIVNGELLASKAPWNIIKGIYLSLLFVGWTVIHLVSDYSLIILHYSELTVVTGLLSKCESCMSQMNHLVKWTGSVLCTRSTELFLWTASIELFLSTGSINCFWEPDNLNNFCDLDWYCECVRDVQS